MSTPQQTSSAGVARVVDGELVSLYARPPRPLSSRPPVRALTAAPLPIPHQAGQKRRSMEDDRSDDLSQPPYSDAESSASSTGGRSEVASSLSSTGKSRRADKSSVPRNHPYPARPPPPMHPQGSSFSFEWKSKDDQRLGELAKEDGLFAWVKIAEILTDEGHGYRIGKQCRER